ncbi:MAG TPA: hypothetical protein VI685_28020 [Candidatus Angelobacter sp.]
MSGYSETSVEKIAFKALGQRFGRSLYSAIKMATLYSADHHNSARPIQQSFDSLVELLKGNAKLTFGFVDQRVLINHILSSDTTLEPLQKEFLKRGIGGVIFEPGLTLARYKRVIEILATSAKAIEAQGGPEVFLEDHQVEGVRIYLAPKTQIRNADGDTLLETDSESLLRQNSKGNGNGPVDMEGLELLLESAGLDRTQASGAGAVGPADILKLVDKTVEVALVDKKGDPEKSYLGLARLLQAIRPDFVLSAFSPQAQGDMRGFSNDQVAAEYLENKAADWAAKRLASAPPGADGLVVEEDVLRVLLRTLEATKTAEQLARKVAQYAKEYALPKTICDRIQEELRWAGLSYLQKVEKLLQLSRFDRFRFRHLLDCLRALLRRNKTADAINLANHYFKVLDSLPSDLSPEELSRAPELINVMGGLNLFISRTGERLTKALVAPALNGFLHYQVANALAALSNSAALYEEFELIETWGVALENRVTCDAAAHKDCCGSALNRLLPVNLVDRIIELALHQRDDTAMQRRASVLLRFMGTIAIDKVFQHLEVERNASRRMILMRLISRAGASGLAVVKKRLEHPEWYVVRNACLLLHEMRDPQLCESLRPVLAHAHDTVQETAVKVLIQSRHPGRALALAESLRFLRGVALEQAFQELAFLKDPAVVPALEDFIYRHHYGDTKKLRLALRALIAIPGSRSQELVSNLASDNVLDESIRKIASGAAPAELGYR